MENLFTIFNVNQFLLICHLTHLYQRGNQGLERSFGIV